MSQNFDTTTADGEFLYTLAAAMATFGRKILSLRTTEGIEAARKRGHGHPMMLKPEQIEEAHRILEADFYFSLTQVTRSFRVHERTLMWGWKDSLLAFIAIALLKSQIFQLLCLQFNYQLENYYITH
ncbi:MAG: recombinase family protein [Candidatus Thiodiazotropha sp. (ex Lucinoma kastoroae)]|nr:recombinase family protein [Candidatus Thiodiazotropha sp. (ex Lucinoma kastoroae)]